MSERYRIKVCDPADYDGRVLIEMEEYFSEDTNSFCVPEWDEAGIPELIGPFVSVEEAQTVLKNNAEYLAWRGFDIIGLPYNPECI